MPKKFEYIHFCIFPSKLLTIDSNSDIDISSSGLSLSWDGGNIYLTPGNICLTRLMLGGILFIESTILSSSWVNIILLYLW